MFRVSLLFVFLASCHSHVVLPVVVPAVHTPVVAPVAPLHGYAGHGLLGYGYVAKPFGHHILKRSPHYVEPLTHVGHVGHVGHVAPVATVAAVAPVAVSHQSRVDVRTSPAVVAAPIISVVKPVVAPLIHGAPLLHKTLVAAPLHYGATPLHFGGHYGSGYSHGGY